MSPATAQLAAYAITQALQTLLDWQTKIADGSISDEELDQLLAQYGQTRAAAQAEIDRRTALGE